VADNVGDCLTYYILTDDKHQVLARSVVRSATRSETNYRLQLDPIIESLVDKEYIERRTKQMGRGNKDKSENCKGKAATANANDAHEDEMVARDEKARDENGVTIVDETAQSAMSEDRTAIDVGYADNETSEGPVRVSDDSTNTASYKKRSSTNSTSMRKQQENYLSNRKLTNRKATSPSRKPKKARDKVTTRNLKTPNIVATPMTPLIPDEEEAKWDIAKTAAAEPTSRRHADRNLLKGEIDRNHNGRHRSKRIRQIPTPGRRYAQLATTVALAMTGMSMVESYPVIPDSAEAITTDEWLLEEDMSSPFLSSVDMDKLHELQMLDKDADDEDSIEWDIVEVSEHRSARTVRRVPGKYDDEFLVRQKHVRVKTHFRNGESQWAQMEAVKLQDTYPLLQYIFRNGLENKKGFDWAQDMVDESERFEQLARVFKAKVDMGPKIKFGVEVPKNATHAIRLDQKNGNRLGKTPPTSSYIRSTSTRLSVFQNPTKTCRNMSTSATTWFSIANSMEGEKVDSLPGEIGQHLRRKISILA
jgi:hypothetical protein